MKDDQHRPDEFTAWAIRGKAVTEAEMADWLEKNHPDGMICEEERYVPYDLFPLVRFLDLVRMRGRNGRVECEYP